MARRVGSVLLTLAVAGLTGWAALVGMLFGFGLKCDESCSAPPRSWADDPDAWQWDVMGWTGVFAFAFSVLLLVLVGMRARERAWAALIGWAISGGVFVALLEKSTLSSSGLVWAAFVAVAGAGAGAVALTRTRAA